ncbi:MAG TPA: BamA/TamA family outer membrane protein [Gemmatimonadaceae bacterium]|nr:BamA/TamA family outer membrane protein [Gemmatimonadaceae bacterium]
MRLSPFGRVLGAAAVLLLLPVTLAAQQVQKAPPVNPEVVRLDFKGVSVMERQEIEKSIATDASGCVSAILTPICWISKSKYFYRKKYLKRDEFERDPLRIRVFYWKRGYRNTEVDTVITPRGTNKVGVTFLVTEGQPTMVSDINVTQTVSVLSEAEIARRLALGEKSPLNLLRLDSSVVFLQQSLWEKGYADAVLDTSVVVDTASKTATVGITIDPKWKATISDVIVEGNQRISTRTILKMLTIQPGDIFRRSEMLRTQRELYESNLFRRAAIEVPRQGDSTKVIVVTVQESPLREARLSTGFSTVDFFQFEGRYTHYNFRGGRRRLEIQGAVGNLFANSLNGKLIFKDVSETVQSDEDRYFSPTYNASVTLTQPWFRARENAIAMSVFTHRRSAPGIYVDRGLGTSLTFTREIADGAPLSANYRFEISRVDAGDVYFCVNYGVCDRPTLEALRDQQRLSPFTLGGSVNRANDPFSPSRGYRGAVDLEHGSSITASDFRYNRATADAALYRQIKKRGTLATHLRLGWVRSLGSTAEAVGALESREILHPRKRFYAGGSRSVRGYGENQLGPSVVTIPAATLRRGDSTCTAAIPITSCNPNAPALANRDFEPRPLGGNVVAETSVELRFPVWRELVGAVFVDAGYVSQRTNPDLPRRKAAVTPGFGGRYRSPVGPIRVDIGINPGRSESLPVVTEEVVDGERRLVTIDQSRVFSPYRTGFRGVLDRMTLHLSIGEAF